MLLENFKVGGLKKYGLDYESLKRSIRGSIYCSITGFGQTGPYAQRAGYDFMIQGMGGIMSITGQPEGTPGAEPMKVGVAFADIYHRPLCDDRHAGGAASPRAHRRGPAHRYGAARLASRGACQPGAQLSGRRRRRPSASAMRIPISSPTRHSDQRTATSSSRSAPTGSSANCARSPACPRSPNDPRFANNRLRVANREALVAAPCRRDDGARPRRNGWRRSKRPPCRAGRSTRSTRSSPIRRSRRAGLEISLTRPDGVETPGVANPIRLSATPIEYEKAPPALGEGTERQ